MSNSGRPKTVAIIGSRMHTAPANRTALPAEIFDSLRRIAWSLTIDGWQVVTGNAEGADEAARLGSYLANGKPLIYTPFMSENLLSVGQNVAKKYHPYWDKMSSFAQKLHGRNYYQVFPLGYTHPVQMVICWTPDACDHHSKRSIKTGGTGTAISIATMESKSTKVFNLANPKTLKMIMDYTAKRENELHQKHCVTHYGKKHHQIDVYTNNRYDYICCEICGRKIITDKEL
jgi:hypothetical protein